MPTQKTATHAKPATMWAIVHSIYGNRFPLMIFPSKEALIDYVENTAGRKVNTTQQGTETFYVERESPMNHADYFYKDFWLDGEEGINLLIEPIEFGQVTAHYND